MLDGRESVNIITKNFKTKLGLPKPRQAPYHLRMANHNMTTPSRIIISLKIRIHGIPYVATFIVLNNNVVDYSYSMLLGRFWLRDVKVVHDWGNNVIIVQGSGIVKTILVNRKLKVETRMPQVFICNDLLKGLTYEDMIFETKLKLF